ncbi:hypothetical protein U2W12_00720 [Methylomicrobium sp. Wu6]|nr:hypothetical protein [Methylomicrobium sp. Wu6]
MATQSFKSHILRVVILLLAVGSLLSTATYGQGEKNEAQPPIPSTSPADSNLPSVEQTLVLEGVFAMQLVMIFESI